VGCGVDNHVPCGERSEELTSGGDEGVRKLLEGLDDGIKAEGNDDGITVGRH